MMVSVRKTQPNLNVARQSLVLGTKTATTRAPVKKSESAIRRLTASAIDIVTMVFALTHAQPTMTAGVHHEFATSKLNSARPKSMGMMNVPSTPIVVPVIKSVVARRQRVLSHFSVKPM